MHLYIVRHGETDHNKNKIYQGHYDSPLNTTGHQQAQKLAQRMKDIPIDHIITSDLQRAQQTANYIIQDKPSSTVTTTEQLRERNFGIFENKSKHILAEHYNTTTDQLRDNHIENHPSVETQTAFITRVNKTIQSFINTDESTLIVCHSGTKVVLTQLLLHTTVKQYTYESSHHTGFSHFVYTDNQRNQQIKNCIIHLES